VDTVITSYTQLGQFIEGILSANGDLPVGGPHKQFWDTLTFDQFKNGNVPGVTDPNTQQPMKILVVGNSKASNLIMALSGATGTVFDPNTGAIGQMPFGGTAFTPEQIKPIADWIDANCPNGPAPQPTSLHHHPKE
jgi:hypothetical protein